MLGQWRTRMFFQKRAPAQDASMSSAFHAPFVQASEHQRVERQALTDLGRADKGGILHRSRLRKNERFSSALTLYLSLDRCFAGRNSFRDYYLTTLAVASPTYSTLLTPGESLESSCDVKAYWAPYPVPCRSKQGRIFARSSVAVVGAAVKEPRRTHCDS